MKKLLLTTALAAMVAIAGTVIADDAPATTYLVYEAQVTGQSVIGLVPEGLRIDGHSRGVFTDGLLAGATTEVIDYLLFRHDGVGVIDVRAYAVDPDGVPVAYTMKGFLGAPSPGMLEAMLDPEFEFPDVDIPIHGAAWFQTMAPHYALLNHTVFGFTGAVNAVQGVMRITFRPIAE